MKLKKIFLSSMLVASMLVIPSNANASESSNVNSINLEAVDIQPFGVSIPTSIWDVTVNGQYNFAGTSNQQDMYTNYKFVGKDSYAVVVTNHSASKLTVKVKTFWNTYYTSTVQPGYTNYFFPSGMDKTDEIYILFQGSPQDFSGYIY